MAGVTCSTTAASSAMDLWNFEYMPTLHLVHGFIGSGKTTFSKKLESEIGAIRFSPDEWIIKEHGRNPPKKLFDSIEKETKEKILACAKTALSEGKDVILDFGFWKKSERDAYKKIGKDLGVNTLLYNVFCDEKTAKMRTLERTKVADGESFFIDENAIDELRQYFEPITDEEAIMVQTDTTRTSASK